MSETTLRREAVIARAAERLRIAAESGVPTTPVRDLVGDTDVALAYEVQSVLTAARLSRGATIIGRKIGLTSPAVQQQLGVNQPDFGVLFDDMVVPNGGTVRTSTLLQPKVEAEIAFVLKDDLNCDDPARIDRAAVLAAVDHAVAALEIVDSRVADWDIRITDTIADNASSGMFVVGARRVLLSEFAPVDVTMTLSKNGESASSGDGAACLGDPVNALLWLARTTAAYGTPLHAGDIVLSGALGPMVSVEHGATFVADLSTLGRVSVTFSQ